MALILARLTLQHKGIVMNSINKRMRTHWSAGETQSIGSPKYKNLKLKKKGKKKRALLLKGLFIQVVM